MAAGLPVVAADNLRRLNMVLSSGPVAEYSTLTQLGAAIVGLQIGRRGPLSSGYFSSFLAVRLLLRILLLILNG